MWQNGHSGEHHDGRHPEIFKLQLHSVYDRRRVREIAHPSGFLVVKSNDQDLASAPGTDRKGPIAVIA
jgi:hypothetical protein